MEGRTLRRQSLRGQFRDGGENGRGRRQEGLGAGGRNLPEAMREEPAGDGTGWVSALSQGELYRGEGAAFLRAQRTGELSGLRKQMVSSEWGFREREKEPRCVKSKVCACPSSLYPLPSSAKVGSGTCPPPASGPAGTAGCGSALIPAEGTGECTLALSLCHP